MSPKLPSFKFKKVLTFFLPLILGAALGVGGTIGAQTYLLPNPETKAEAPRREGPLVPIGEFTVNLQGNAFLRTEIVIEGVDKKAEEYLVDRVTFLKDRVVSVLSDKSIAEVSTKEEREKLRTELIAELNEVADNRVYNVLFLSFVYQ